LVDAWSPFGRIGQPLAWATVAAYLATAGLACLSAVRPRDREGSSGLRHCARRNGRPWITITLVLLALAVDAQVDLLGLATAAVRERVAMQGWYAERREAQAAGLVLLIAVALAAGGTLLRTNRHKGAPALIAGSAMVALLTFLVGRAASLHAVDAFLGTRFAGLRLSRIVELGCIGMVALGAALSLRPGHDESRAATPTPDAIRHRRRRCCGRHSGDGEP